MSGDAHVLFACLAAICLPGCEKSPAPETRPPPVGDRSGHAGAAQGGEVEVVPVAGKVHMLVGRGGNIGASVGSDGILIVDDQFAELAPDIRRALASLSEGDLAYVLNTHHHPDHTGGNPVFGEEATIVAHTNVRRRLAQSGQSPPALPVITFSERMSIHFNGEEIRARHFPHGHTDGDIVISFADSGVIHMGDHFFNGRFPYVDLDAGGDVVQMRKNVEAVLETAPEGARIIPGHGPLGGPSDLRAYRDMLAETTAYVKKKMDAGAELPAIKKAGLPDKWESWGRHFISTERWIEIIHRSLKGRGASSP